VPMETDLAGAPTFVCGEQVVYENHRSGAMELATVVGVQHETSPPHYTILVDGQERQTEATRLRACASSPPANINTVSPSRMEKECRHAHTRAPPSLTAPHVSLTASQPHHPFAHPHTHPLAHTLSTCIAHTRHSIASQVDGGSGVESVPAESHEAAAPEAAAVHSARRLLSCMERLLDHVKGNPGTLAALLHFAQSEFGPAKKHPDGYIQTFVNFQKVSLTAASLYLGTFLPLPLPDPTFP
jgi:hypothetical protein